MDPALFEVIINNDPLRISLVTQWLVKLGDHEASVQLSNMCCDAEYRIRVCAMIVAGRHYKSFVRDFGVSLLSDSIAIVRWVACEAIMLANCRSATGELAKLILYDEEAKVRNIAAIAIGVLGSNTDVPALRLALSTEAGHDHEGRSIREVINSSIAQIKERESSP